MNQGNVNPYTAPGADLDAGLAGGSGSPLAGRGPRLGASLIDGLIAGAVPWLLILITSFLAGAVSPKGQPGGGGAGILIAVGFILAGIWFVAVVIYQIYGLSTRGQTLGKKWLGIRIVKIDGSPISFGSAVMMRAFVPGLLGIVPGFGLVDQLFIFREDRRCIHDLMAGTRVVVAQ